MRYRFSRNAVNQPAVEDIAEVQELSVHLAERPRGPLAVTGRVRAAAEAQLIKFAREHALAQNRDPQADDFVRVAQLHPVLLRLSRGDVVVDAHAEVA